MSSCVLFNTNLRSKGNSRQLFVIGHAGKLLRLSWYRPKIHSPPFIGKETLTALGMLKIQPDCCFTDPNDMAVSKEGHSANTVKEVKGEQDLKDLITKYSQLF